MTTVCILTRQSTQLLLMQFSLIHLDEIFAIFYTWVVGDGM